MCRVRLRGNVTLELFPSLDCDDMRDIELMDVQEHAELEIQVVQVNHGISFTLADGRSSSLPPEALQLVTPCYCCEDDWHLVLGS